MQREICKAEYDDVMFYTTSNVVQCKLKANAITFSISVNGIVVFSPTEDILYIAPPELNQLTYVQFPEFNVSIDYSEWDLAVTIIGYGKQILIDMTHDKYILSVIDADDIPETSEF